MCYEECYEDLPMEFKCSTQIYFFHSVGLAYKKAHTQESTLSQKFHLVWES